MGAIRRKPDRLPPEGDPQRLYVQGSKGNRERKNMKLEAQWIVGFTDGEGCFHLGIARHDGMASGYQVLPEFTIVQHERDVAVLHALKAHFGAGVVRRNHGDRMAYRVRKLDHLLGVIVPFFMKHPLKTKKHVDFRKFRSALLLMETGRHLTPEGLREIRALAGKMNRKAP